jgi:DNA-binding protein HU-beta
MTRFSSVAWRICGAGFEQDSGQRRQVPNDETLINTDHHMANARKATTTKPASKPAVSRTTATKSAAAKPAAAKVAAPKPTITLKTITADLAEKYELTKKDANLLMGDLVTHVVKNLKKGNRIRIPGLGSLQVRKHAARKGRNPATGESIKIPAKKKIAFRAAKDLKEAVGK